MKNSNFPPIQTELKSRFDCFCKIQRLFLKTKPTVRWFYVAVRRSQHRRCRTDRAGRVDVDGIHEEKYKNSNKTIKTKVIFDNLEELGSWRRPKTSAGILRCYSEHHHI